MDPADGAVQPAFHSLRAPPPTQTGARVGVVVPPANATVEAELPRLLGSRSDLVVTRFRAAEGDLRVRLANYAQQIPDRLADFAGLPLDAVYIACTGCFYEQDPADVRSLQYRLNERWGIPVVLPVNAIGDAYNAIGGGPTVVVSPYPRWLTEASERFWRRTGMAVSQVVDLGNGDPYAVHPDALVRAVLEHPRSCACLMFTGTGMPTLAAMEKIRQHTDVPLLSSNWCSAWRVQRMLTAASGAAPDLEASS